MAQAGMHALVGTLVKKVAPRREWLLLGIILGNLLPDMDNYLVAVATVAGLATEGLHRTFTHSLVGMVVVLVLFWGVSKVWSRPRWFHLGIGIAVGMGMHILLDLLLWFNGVELLWPFGGWIINFWAGSNPPAWLMTLLDPAEFLFFALFLLWLWQTARQQQTNGSFLRTLRLWLIVMLVLLLIFTPLAYLMAKGFLTIFGAVYLIALTAAFVITIRMRQTVEQFSG